MSNARNLSNFRPSASGQVETADIADAAVTSDKLTSTTVSAGSYTYSSITVDAAGRLTAASSGASPSAFPSGTRLMFAQNTAPTGWTKDTTNYDNHAIRIVTGTAGTTGGSVDFSTAFASQTPSGSVSVNVSGLSAGATTLSTSQIPSHTHDVPAQRNACDPTAPRSSAGSGTGAYQTFSSFATGGGGSHSHSISGSATGSFTGNAINLAVKYLNVITATKD